MPNPPDSPPFLFEIRECRRSGCGLRFPAAASDIHRLRCPKCRAETQLAETYQPLPPTPGERTRPPAFHIELLVDNLRSKLNVGAIFRIADGAGISHVHLCGITPTPQTDHIKKTALGAENSVAWSYHPNGLAAARELKEQGSHLWGLETGPESRSLLEDRDQINPPRLVLGIGSEVTGLDPGILRICERVVHLPMAGMKESLNVAVACGIAVYTLAFRKNFP
jgi:tRNA G18 (ribose-2'-O)-methylase SpoU